MQPFLQMLVVSQSNFQDALDLECDIFDACEYTTVATL